MTLDICRNLDLYVFKRGTILNVKTIQHYKTVQLFVTQRQCKLVLKINI